MNLKTLYGKDTESAQYRYYGDPGIYAYLFLWLAIDEV